MQKAVDNFLFGLCFGMGFAIDEQKPRRRNSGS